MNRANSNILLAGVCGLVLLTSCSSSNVYTAQDAALIRAVNLADKADYDAALAKGANVNAQSPEGMTPLMMAVIADKPLLIRDLLKRGADVNCGDKKGNTPLHIAVGKRYTDSLRVLLEYPVLTDPHGSYGRTPLMDAARLGHPEAVELLLLEGADVNAVDEMGRTPLMHAAMAKRNSLPIVKMLLAKGANHEMFDNDSMTAAMHAAALAHTDSAKHLINLYPDFSEKPAIGLLIAKYAIKGRDQAIVSLLIDKKLPLNWELSRALKETKRVQVHGIYRIMVRNGILAKGRTPLIWAAMENDLEMVKLLIARGADPGQPDENGDRPYDMATDREVIRYLKKATTEYNQKQLEAKTK